VEHLNKSKQEQEFSRQPDKRTRNAGQRNRMNRAVDPVQAKTTKKKKKKNGALTDVVQQKMENAFDADFSSVNIKTNSSEAKDMGALAFTQGENVHFAPGQFDPNNTKGQKLIGHELTHVVQQREGRVQKKKQAKPQNEGQEINDDPQLEAEADEMGKRAAEGKGANVSGKGSGVQRQSENPINNASMCVPFPEDVDKEQLISQANSKIEDIRSLNSNLIRSCILAISNVENLIALEDSDMLKVFVQKLLGSALDKIASTNKILEASYLIVKAGMEANSASSAVQDRNKIALSFVDINTRLQNFDTNITSKTQEIKNSFSENYNLTKYIASLEISPSDYDEIRTSANRFEANVWKQVLPLKWKHMVSNQSSFHTNLDFIDRMESKHKNIYYTYEKGTQGLIWQTDGYYIKEHWLGSGSSPLFHDKAPEELAKHLFETLGISKKEVFENWGLPRQIFVINSGGMYGY